MGRPPCCDKDGVKKGPWTPEEDIVLVSYIQEHGPGNWRSVPTNTGLLRCSKSCRLRWTNYLRPGIKRGNFTSHEEGMIIFTYKLYWATTIASYLPERTDNDIKNYWNTHLKKKLNNKYQQTMEQLPHHHYLINSSQQLHHPSNNMGAASSSTSSSNNGVITCVHNNYSPSPLLHATTNSSSLTSSSYYASSTENISRLLEGWMRTSPKTNNKQLIIRSRSEHESSCEDLIVVGMEEDEAAVVPNKDDDTAGHEMTMWGKGRNECFDKEMMMMMMKQQLDEEGGNGSSHGHQHHNNPPFSIFEKWLFEETSTSGGGQVEEMQLSPIF